MALSRGFLTGVHLWVMLLKAKNAFGFRQPSLEKREGTIKWEKLY